MKLAIIYTEYVFFDNGDKERISVVFSSKQCPGSLSVEVTAPGIDYSFDIYPEKGKSIADNPELWSIKAAEAAIKMAAQKTLDEADEKKEAIKRFL